MNPHIFFDTHAHLDFPDFEADLPEVICRAEAAGIARIISIGTDFKSSERAVQLAETHPNLFAAVGWHPGHAAEAPADIRPALRELAKHPKVVAIGETGLDYYRLPEAPEEIQRQKRKQADVFRQQIELAVELGLNLVVHQRESMADTLAQLQVFTGKVRAVFHCFVDDADTMRRIIGMNCLVSFTGILTFKNAQSVRDTLAAAPLDRFMLETDCPYLAPVPHRGKRCEPAYVAHIAETVAKVKGCSLDELSRATCETAEAFFPRMRW